MTSASLFEISLRLTSLNGHELLTEEQMRACVLDGGTRFVAPGQVTYNKDVPDLIEKVSDERKELTEEDARRAQPALGDAVEQLDLAGCEQLTDATVIEIGPRCPNLRVAMLGRVHLRRRARPLPLHRLMSPALLYRGSVRGFPDQTSKLTDPSIIALANACKSLVTLDLQYASSRADARARARARDARVAARAAPYSRRTRSALTRARAAPLPSRPMRLTLARASPAPSRFRSRQVLQTADGPEHTRDRAHLQEPEGAQRFVRVAARRPPFPRSVSHARPISLSSGTATS